MMQWKLSCIIRRLPTEPPKTIRGYKHTLNIYHRRTGLDLNNPLSLKKSVLEFLGYYENPYSYNLHRTHLRAFFNWCIEEEIIEGKNPVKGTPFKKTSPGIRHLDDKTLGILLDTPDKRTYDGFRDYTMMLVMLDCGIRPGELLQLLPRHFDVERATIHVVDSIAKARIERILNISSPTVNAIKKVISARHPLWGDNVPIFCSRDGREMTSSTWGHEFEKYVKRGNLDDAISPYDLRHTFAIMFLRNDYYGAAEPLVRSGESHPSGKAEPPLWCEINSLFLFVNHTFPSWRACLPDS